ncbi:MAG: MBL fold metallo-hydrolase, partial [Candidatus Limnocylindrales bacterium]
ELHEEAGVVVAGIERLAPIAHWTTPRFMPRRFSTWFFVADLPPGAEPEFSADEVVAHRWLTPAAALEQVASGEIGMWVPTTSVLEQLIALGAGAAGDVARALTFGSVASPELVEVGPAVARWIFGAMGGVPGRTGLTEIHGRDELVAVDPGDPSEAAIGAIESHVAERGAAIRAIVLTATDPDHAAGAEALAIPPGIPILVAPGAGRHLPYPTVEVADGERLPCDVDLCVRLGPAGAGRLQIVASAGE